ncbi:MAG: MASE1 domain-containing protein, partial [Pseudorhodoplanes sp.]
MSLPFSPDLRRPVHYGATLCATALLYLALAKGGLVLASINPSASPIWPPTGFAIAALLIGGYNLWPAIFLGAFVINLITAGSVATTLTIAAGNTLEAFIAAYLVNQFSGGRDTFANATRVALFALLCLAPTALSATMGVWSLTFAGHAHGSEFVSIWFTWWIGDFAGAMVVTPVLLLWANSASNGLSALALTRTAIVLLATCAVGLLAFSPLIAQTPGRTALGFLAVAPLLWAALRQGPRDTATVSLLLAAFAIWGALANGGPFARANLNDSFLILLSFILSASVPSLALAADMAVRRRSEDDLRTSQGELDRRMRSRTEELTTTNRALAAEVDRRKMMEAELRLQTAHLAEAQRFVNLGSWVWEIGPGTLSWSEQLFDIYGVDPAHFSGTFEDFVKALHPDDRERVQAEITRALRHGEPFQIEERIVRPDGKIRHLQSSGEVIKDAQGHAVRMVGICQDVTERRQVVSSLRDTETQYRLIIESVHDYAIYILDPSGNISSWNTGAQRIKQFAAHEVLGSHFGRFYAPEDREAGLPQRALRIAENEGKYESEGWHFRKDGTRFWASVVIDPIYDETGHLIGFAKITRDMTEQREAQQNLERAREQLAQSQKMEAIGQLTGGIAHDFNNLLMIVSGHAQLLARRLKEPEHQRALEAISSAANRGETLTRQLLAFSRRQVLNPVVVDLREHIESVRRMLDSSLREDITFSRDVPDDLWRTEIDLAEFELALINIAVNARDAMPEGGRIHLSARNVTLPPGQVQDISGDFVALSLADSGIGIEPEILTRIFEPFFTTKAVGKGTGLGLSQVYGFARQSGGGVGIESRPGWGTTVTIYLPRTDKAIMPIAAAGNEHSPSRIEGTILV